MLTDKQKQFYEENGYLILRECLPPDEATDLRRELFSILSKPWSGSIKLGLAYEKEAVGKDPENPLGANYVMASPLLGDTWFKLTLDERLVQPVIDLLGPDINLHDQKIPMKPPGHVTKQRWHQDWAYEEHDRPELAAVLLYLDDTAPDAGATKLSPRSHKRGPLPHDRPDSLSIDDELIGDDWIQPEMHAGDVIIIHTWLAHSIGDNLSDTTKAMVAHVYKTLQAIDTHGNHRVMAEMPVARAGRIALRAEW